MNEKIAIAVPHFGQSMYEAFWWSWSMMLGRTLSERPGDYVLLKPTFPSQMETEKRCISEIRNNLVEQALDEVCTKFIMLDTDQVYPSDAIIKLLSHDKPIVSGQVHRRYPPFDPIMLRGELHKYQSIPFEEMYADKLVEIDATGAACMCIDMKVFLDVQYPWFEDIPKTKEDKLVGEDINFCWKARQEGYPIYMDTSIHVGHLGLREFGKFDHILYKKVEAIHQK
jgi:hypothetical protein